MRTRAAWLVDRALFVSLLGILGGIVVGTALGYGGLGAP